MLRTTFIFIIVLTLAACSSTYQNVDITGKVFPTIKGTSLNEQIMTIPADLPGETRLLLIGYVQDSQFDIDRWLIGLDMTETKVPVYELPIIAGMAPRMFSTFIDNGMRKGIPKAMWGGVITVYKQGAEIQQLTGNQDPNNARVVLIDKMGKILYFYDDGFSVSALNDVRNLIR